MTRNELVKGLEVLVGSEFDNDEVIVALETAEDDCVYVEEEVTMYKSKVEHLDNAQVYVVYTELGDIDDTAYIIVEDEIITEVM